MFWVLVGFLVVVAVFVFTLIGFFQFLTWIFGSPKPDQPKIQVPTLNADVLASRRLLDHLRSKDQISEPAYHELRCFLEKTYPDTFEASARRQPATAADSSVLKPQVSSHSKTSTAKSSTNTPAKGSSSTAEPRASVLPPATSLTGASLFDVSSPASKADLIVIAESVTPIAKSTAFATNQTPAPWDMPDPPTPEPLIPRRSFGELMSGFMQEKNMRWGELTSGILIVLSAVGLVVSLREELRNTIPYFSALLFMLITAAIHGAGIYTLKKWKLRNTSRGTLVIGLLLVPLNFVAACVLSERRALTEPWLWIAVVVGLTVFTFMTWKSTKHLLRRGNLPMTIAIIGCGVGALILNRSVESASASFQYLVFAIPVVASFLIGTCAFDSRQWTRERWSVRASNRVFLYLGICVFAAVAALSLVIVRADSKLVGLVAISPIVSVVCLVVSWIGSIVSNGTNSKLLSTSADLAVATNQSEEVKPIRLAGLSLKVLGLILLTISIFASAFHPTMFIINTFVSGVGMIVFFIHQRDERMLPAAWAVLTFGILAAVNLFTGNFGFDQWASATELQAALLNGKSGLCLLAVGIVVAIANTVLQKNISLLAEVKSFRAAGWVTGGAIFLVGCSIALVASLIHRENQFDVMTASGLLLLAAIGALVVCAIANRKGIAKAVELPHAAAVLLAGALVHAILWNPTLSRWVNQLVGIEYSGWALVCAIHSCVMVCMGVALSRTRKIKKDDGELVSVELVSVELVSNEKVSTRTSTGGFPVDWAAISTLALMLCSLFLIPYQTGWATFFFALSTLQWLLIGWTWTRNGSEFRQFAAAPFVLASGMLVSVAIAELMVKTSWCPPISSAKHWLVHLAGLSVWSIAWSVILAFVARRPRLKWLSTSNVKVDQLVLFLLVFAIGGFVCDTLLPAAAELSASSNFVSNFGLSQSPSWIVGTMVLISVALIVSLVVQPNAAKGFALVTVWMLAWAAGAGSFEESKSVASALRWLLPIGGLVGAIAVALRRPILPAWSLLRINLNMSGASYWRGETTKQLINFALAIVALVVLLISTFTVGQVLLKGGGSLGGPLADSWFNKIPAEISFGAPIAFIVGTFLLYAISERRSWLATIGSAVFQYIVVLAVVLLFLSQHPKIASTWFVNILKAVSLGMTGYGFLWFYFRDRIEGREPRGSLLPEVTKSNAQETNSFKPEPTLVSPQAPLSSTSDQTWLGRISQIQVHTLLNGLLVTSLAVLAMGRFFFVPDQPGSWVSSVGSPLGVIAWATFGVLAFFVWRNNLTKSHSTSTWVWLTGWMGLILVGLLAAVIDRNYSLPGDFVAWRPYHVVMVGMVVVTLLQTGLIFWLDRRTNSQAVSIYDSTESGKLRSLSFPLMLTGAIALTYSVRGVWLDSNSFGLYIGVIAVLSILATAVGWMLRDGKLAFVSTGVALIGVAVAVWLDKVSWMGSDQPVLFHLSIIVSAAVAAAWIVYCLVFQRRNAGSDETPVDPSVLAAADVHGSRLPGSFLWQSNVVLLVGSLWILAAALLQFGAGNWTSSYCFVEKPLSFLAIASMVGLSGLSLWSERSLFRVFSWCALSLAIGITIPSVLVEPRSSRFVGVVLAISLVVALWGSVWLNRRKVFAAAKQLGVNGLPALENLLRRQVPIYTLLIGFLAVVAATTLIFNADERIHRYLAAMVPFAVAIGIGTQSDQNSRRWLQLLTLGLSTVGVLFLAWADLSRNQMVLYPMVRLFVRSLIVLSGAMFVYGGLVTRWVREGDTWLKSLREMAVVTCGLAIGCLVLVLTGEATAHFKGLDQGMLLGESITVAVLVASMIVGLIVIAMRPEKDPFALSLNGRMGYVYAAEFVSLAWIAHLYFTMPFLFQFGIKAYWPYIMMAICFGGFGVAKILEKRNLTVLGQPMFNTAVVLPLIVAFAIFMVDSKAQAELVMLTVGLAYLLISYTHKSMLSGAAAIVFGNLALWMIFNRVNFSFFDHPQLWLIPPAVSVLIAGQLSKSQLSLGQLSVVRYICMAVIYVSSTMEVFISGIGTNLWPPVILAVLSVIGIMSGMMFRVKSFLFFGSLFLLMAMVTMVAHAHQSFNHVWPWWAFGIGLGIAILVMFGLFEKKKNEMQAIAGSLREWEA